MNAGSVVTRGQVQHPVACMRDPGSGFDGVTDGRRLELVHDGRGTSAGIVVDHEDITVGHTATAPSLREVGRSCGSSTRSRSFR